MWMGEIHEMQYKFNTKVTFRLLECRGYDLNLFLKASKKAYIEQKEKKEKEKEVEVASLYFLRSSRRISTVFPGIQAFMWSMRSWKGWRHSRSGAG